MRIYELEEILELECRVDVKGKLIEFVQGSISQEKLDNLLIEDYQECFISNMYDLEESDLDEYTVHILVKGMLYDNVIDSLDQYDNLKEVLIDEEKLDIVFSAITKLREYDVFMYQILEDFDKSIDLDSELILPILKNRFPDINFNIEVNSYDKFYPYKGQFHSLASSDHCMYRITIKVVRDFYFEIYDQGDTRLVELKDLLDIDFWDWIMVDAEDENRDRLTETITKIKECVKELFEIDNANYQESKKIIDWINDLIGIDYYYLIINKKSDN